jgi:hypothetical protein
MLMRPVPILIQTKEVEAERFASVGHRPGRAKKGHKVAWRPAEQAGERGAKDPGWSSPEPMPTHLGLELSRRSYGRVPYALLRARLRVR